MGTPEQLRQEIRSTIEQKPFESSAAGSFFTEWCAINDDITPVFLKRENWQAHSGRVLRYVSDGSKILYLPLDLQLWEMAAILEAIDSDTFANDPREQKHKAEELRILGLQFTNAAIYIAQRLDSIHEGKAIAQALVEEFYGYGQALATGEKPVQESSIDDIAQFVLSEEEIKATEQLLRLKKGKKDTLVQVFRVAEKAVALQIQSDAGALWKLGGSRVPPWQARTPIHTALLRAMHRNITITIETPKRESEGSIFRRGIELLKNTMTEPHTFFSFLASKLHVEQKTLLLRERLNISDMKRRLSEVRSSGDPYVIRKMEREITSAIQEAVCAFTYEEDSNYPSEIVETRRINCVGASMLGGAILSEVGITCLVGHMPEHSTIFVVRSDGGVEWRDMLTTENNQVLMDEIISGRNEDGTSMKVQNIAAFSKQPTPQGLTLRADLTRKIPQPYKDEQAVTLYELTYGLQLQLLNNMGADLLEADRIPEAIEAYRLAVALDPHYAYAYNGLAAALSELGRDDEAIEVYQQSVALDPSCPDSYPGLGNCFYRLGRNWDALRTYKRFLSLADRKKDKDSIEEVKGAIAEIKAELRSTGG